MKPTKDQATDGQKLAEAYRRHREENPPMVCSKCQAASGLWYYERWGGYLCNPCMGIAALERALDILEDSGAEGILKEIRLLRNEVGK